MFILGFNSINFEDKTLLIHSSTHSVILMCFCVQSLRLELVNNNWNYLNIQLNHLTYSFENQLKILKLDDKEIGLMLCLLIISIG